MIVPTRFALPLFAVGAVTLGACRSTPDALPADPVVAGQLAVQAPVQDPATGYAGFGAKSVEVPDPVYVDDPQHGRGAVYDEYEALVHIGPGLSLDDFLASVAALASRLGDSPAFADAPSLAAREIVLGQLERTKAALQGLDGDLFEAMQSSSTAADAWAVLPADGLPDGWEVVGLFKDPQSGQVSLPVRARHSVMDETTLRTTETWFVYLAVEPLRELLCVADLTRRMLRRVVPVQRAADRLAKNDRAWENFMRRGYSQYPWENVVNDWLVDSAWDDPPSSQWVFLHPEPGIIIDARRSSTSDVDAALLVHGLGYLYYGGDERDWFLGLSATGVVTEDSDNGLGGGFTLHYGQTTGKSAIPHISAGVLWQDSEDGDDGVSVSLGVDVFRLLSNPDVDRLRSALLR